MSLLFSIWLNLIWMTFSKRGDDLICHVSPFLRIWRTFISSLIVVYFFYFFFRNYKMILKGITQKYELWFSVTECSNQILFWSAVPFSHSPPHSQNTHKHAHSNTHFMNSLWDTPQWLHLISGIVTDLWPRRSHLKIRTDRHICIACWLNDTAVCVGGRIGMWIKPHSCSVFSFTLRYTSCHLSFNSTSDHTINIKRQ